MGKDGPAAAAVGAANAATAAVDYLPRVKIYIVCLVWNRIKIY